MADSGVLYMHGVQEAYLMPWIVWIHWVDLLGFRAFQVSKGIQVLEWCTRFQGLIPWNAVHEIAQRIRDKNGLQLGRLCSNYDFLFWTMLAWCTGPVGCEMKSDTKVSPSEKLDSLI